jgi:hypothetical protein
MIHAAKPVPMLKLCAACLCMAALVTAVAGCSAYKGYAVILWAQKDWPFTNGQIADIYKIYDVDRKYVALFDKDTVDLPQWRVMFFEGLDQAKEFAERYKPLVNTFALCRRNDLPVRAEAAAGSDRVTKLKSGEIVKVIEKGAREKIGNMEDYWYRILTDRGFLGYTYGYYLDISDDPEKFEKKSPTQLNPDSLIDALLDNTWVPVVVDDMIKSGMIDLDLLKKNYGLVLDQEEKKVALNLEGFAKEYRYTNITKTESGKLTFDGTDLKIEISPSSNKIFVDYVKNGKNTRAELIMLDTDLNKIIWQEQKRRNDMFAAILQNGDTLTSSSGGMIHLSANQGFTWENTEGITPQIIPQDSSGQGRISFKYFLSFGLRTRYDGVITFYFTGSPGFERTFVYTLAGNRLKMIYVPDADIENLLVMRAGGSALDFEFSSGE